MQHVFRADQPITKNFEEPLRLNLLGCVEVGWKRPNRFLVHLKKQAVFAAEMLEDRTFGDTELRSDVAHAGGVVSLLSKMPHGSIDDPGTLCVRARARRNVRTVTWWTGQAGRNAAHD